MSESLRYRLLRNRQAISKQARGRLCCLDLKTANIESIGYCHSPDDTQMLLQLAADEQELDLRGKIDNINTLRCYMALHSNRISHRLMNKIKTSGQSIGIDARFPMGLKEAELADIAEACAMRIARVSPLFIVRTAYYTRLDGMLYVTSLEVSEDWQDSSDLNLKPTFE